MLVIILYILKDLTISITHTVSARGDAEMKRCPENTSFTSLCYKVKISIIAGPVISGVAVAFYGPDKYCKPYSVKTTHFIWPSWFT